MSKSINDKSGGLQDLKPEEKAGGRALDINRKTRPPSKAGGGFASVTDTKKKTEKRSPDLTFTAAEKAEWRVARLRETEERSRLAMRIASDYVNEVEEGTPEKEERLAAFGSFLKCHRKHVGPVELVDRGGGVLAVAGVWRCGSKWACPSCASRLLFADSRRIRSLLEAVVAENVSRAVDNRPPLVVMFLTLTGPHKHGENLREHMEAFSAAFGKMFHCTKIRKARLRLGFLGSVRCFDHTVSIDEEGRLNWHAHLHNVLVFDTERPSAVLLPNAIDNEEKKLKEVLKRCRELEEKPSRAGLLALKDAEKAHISAEKSVKFARKCAEKPVDLREDSEDFKQFYKDIFESWKRCLGEQYEDGREASVKGFSLEVVDLGSSVEHESAALADYAAKVAALPGYLTKAAKDREEGEGGEAWRRGLAPWDLLDLYGKTGREEYARAWVEYVEGSKGFHRVDFSSGLSDSLGVSEDLPEVSARYVLPSPVAAVAMGDSVVMDEIKHALGSGDVSAVEDILARLGLSKYAAEVCSPLEVEKRVSEARRALLRFKQEKLMEGEENV